jgi:GcrA cell cycle regulator
MWTIERVHTLKTMRAAGASAAEIAAALGRGITRNAVIGKAHRLGSAGSGKSGRPRTPREAPPPRKRVRPTRLPSGPRRLRWTPPGPTKSELRSMLAEAVRNTAALSH